MAWQQTVVGIMVGAAMVFAAWRLPGTATRLRYISWMRRVSRNRGPLTQLAAWLESRLRRKESACAGCSASSEHPPR